LLFRQRIHRVKVDLEVCNIDEFKQLVKVAVKTTVGYQPILMLNISSPVRTPQAVEITSRCFRSIL